MVITRSWTRRKRSSKRDNAKTSTHNATPKGKTKQKKDADVVEPKKASDENHEETSTFMTSIPIDVIYALNCSSMQHLAVKNVKVEHITCEQKESTLYQSLKDLPGQETFENNNTVVPIVVSSPVQFTDQTIPSDEVILPGSPIKLEHHKSTPNAPICNGDTMVSISTDILYQMNVRPDRNVQQFQTPKREILEHTLVDLNPVSMLIENNCGSHTVTADDDSATNTYRESTLLQSLKDLGGQETFQNDNAVEPLSPVKIMKVIMPSDEVASTIINIPHGKSALNTSTSNEEMMLSNVLSQLNARPDRNIQQFLTPKRVISEHNFIDSSPASTVVKYECSPNEDEFLKHPHETYLTNYSDGIISSEKRIGNNEKSSNPLSSYGSVDLSPTSTIIKEDGENSTITTDLDSDIVDILDILSREEDFSESVKLSKESPNKSPKVLSTRNSQDIVSERTSAVSGFDFPLLPKGRSFNRKSHIDLGPASTLIKHDGSPSRQDDFLEHPVDHSDAARLSNYSEERIVLSKRNDNSELCHASYTNFTSIDLSPTNTVINEDGESCRITTAFDSGIVEILSGEEDLSGPINLSNENTRKSPLPAELSTRIIQNIVLETTPAESTTVEKGQSSVQASFVPIFDFPIIPKGSNSIHFNHNSRVDLNPTSGNDFFDHTHGAPLSNYVGKRNVSKKRKRKKKKSSKLNRGFNQKLPSSNSKKTSHCVSEPTPLNSRRTYKNDNAFNLSARKKRKKWFARSQKRRIHGTDYIPFKRRKIQSETFRSPTLAKHPDILFSPVSPEFSDSEKLEDAEVDYGWEDRAPPKPEPQSKSTFEELDPSIEEKMKIFNSKLRSEYDLDVIEASRKDLCRAIEDSIAIQSHKKLTELDQRIQKEKDDYARELFGTDNFDSWDDDPALSNVENTQKLKQFQSSVSTDVHLMERMCMKNAINVTRPTSARGENKFMYLSRIKQIESQYNGQEWPLDLIQLIKNEKKIISDQVIKFIMPYYNAGRIQPKELFGSVARKISHIFYETLEGEEIIKGYIDDIFLKNEVVTEHFLRA